MLHTPLRRHADFQQQISELFSDRLRQVGRMCRGDAPHQQEFQRACGGLNDAASLLGLEEIARHSQTLLEGKRVDEETLRAALPTVEALHDRLSAFSTAPSSSTAQIGRAHV